MFIAMNRFQIVKGREADFEAVWQNRQTHLDEVPGFIDFALLRGPETDEATLYASHTRWENREAFEAWTRSEHFRQAHAEAGQHRDLYRGPPQFEGFEVVPGA